MTTPDILGIVYVVGIIPSAFWMNWLDRDSIQPSPVLNLVMAFLWPVVVPATAIMIGFIEAAYMIHRLANRDRER